MTGIGFAAIQRLACQVFDVPAALVTLGGKHDGVEPGSWLSYPDIRSDSTVEGLAAHPICSQIEELVGFAAIPLWAEDEEVLGWLSIADERPLKLDATGEMTLVDLRELAELQISVRSAAAVQAELLDVATAEHRRSLLDPMTGAWNRRGILLELDKAIKAVPSGTGFTVILTDVDRFKSINDTYGHAAGDDVIRAIASRLESVSRDGDSVGRLGGDEFLVVLPNCGSRDAAEQIVSRMYEQVRSCPVSARVGEDSIEIPVTLSLGVAVVPGAASIQRDAAVELADQAMYATKRNGRDGFSIIEAIELDAA